jgi:hypothetical protein
MEPHRNKPNPPLHRWFLPSASAWASSTGSTWAFAWPTSIPFRSTVKPGVQGYYVSINDVSLGVVYLHLPVLLGLNFSKDVSLVLSPGFVYSVASATVDNGTGVGGAASSTGFFGRLGLGFDFRIGKRFAIHPEITAMKEFSDSDALIYVGGIGFNIGAQPDYSDLEGPGDIQAPPAGPPASANPPPPSSPPPTTPAAPTAR